jgi:hypothetical protein
MVRYLVIHQCIKETTPNNNACLINRIGRWQVQKHTTEIR